MMSQDKEYDEFMEVIGNFIDRMEKNTKTLRELDEILSFLVITEHERFQFKDLIYDICISSPYDFEKIGGKAIEYFKSGKFNLKEVMDKLKICFSYIEEDEDLD